MKLLLDVHIPAAVADTLRRRQPRLDVPHLARWKHSE